MANSHRVLRVRHVLTQTSFVKRQCMSMITASPKGTIFRAAGADYENPLPRTGLLTLVILSRLNR